MEARAQIVKAAPPISRAAEKYVASPARFQQQATALNTQLEDLRGRLARIQAAKGSWKDGQLGVALGAEQKTWTIAKTPSGPPRGPQGLAWFRPIFVPPSIEAQVKGMSEPAMKARDQGRAFVDGLRASDPALAAKLAPNLDALISSWDAFLSAKDLAAAQTALTQAGTAMATIQKQLVAAAPAGR